MSGGADWLALAEALAPRLVALRRHLHRHPELAWEETGTRAALAAELAAAGIASREVAGTGLVARVRGGAGDGGPVVALRAELDALPIAEQTGHEYASEHAGVMHACGHDAHMTMVLGAGLLLAAARESLSGDVVLLFQPAEEVPPGGARRVIEEGVLEREKVGAIFGLHVDPRYPAGQLLLRRGPLMAASDRFRLTVTGRGGHGGYPHLTVDPVVIAAQIVLALQTVVSRRVDPTEPAVVSVGQIAGGTADNIIPDEVRLSGTIRTHSPRVREDVPRWIEETAAGIAAGGGATCLFEHLPGHPGLANDPAMIEFVAGAAGAVLGTDRLVDLPRPIMGGEDFAHYLERLPGAFLRLGVRNEAKGCVFPLHNARFNLDEDALPVGAAALAAVAAAWLADGDAPGRR